MTLTSGMAKLNLAIFICFISETFPNRFLDVANICTNRHNSHISALYYAIHNRKEMKQYMFVRNFSIPFCEFCLSLYLLAFAPMFSENKQKMPFAAPSSMNQCCSVTLLTQTSDVGIIPSGYNPNKN